MRMLAVTQPAATVDADVLAIGVAGNEPLAGAAAELDAALGGLLRRVREAGEHRGRLNEVLPVHTGGATSAGRVLLYGLGPRRDLDGQRLRFAHHEMARAARGYGYRRLALVASGSVTGGDLAGAVEGTVMGSWERRSRQTGARPARLDQVTAVGFGAGVEAALLAAQEVAEAVNQAREWQNLPPNELTPEALAEEARRIADRHSLEFEELGPEELKAHGYNLLLGVASGSARPPRLVRLTYRGTPAGDQRPALRLALVGKGITFDSGGLSLKSADGMLTMKGDMGGAAAVLCALDVIAARRPDFDVMAIVAATENMTGSAAQRPGDIITSAAGKTVEIVNTDAEGRLVLADAITHALRHGATHLVDVATLTGAATVALGHAATAAVSNDDAFWSILERAGAVAGERAWRLPIYPEYSVLLASRVADLRNGNYGEAGTITAGMFIQQFVDGRPWVHLDIAASAWNSHDRLTTIPRGPLGAGTRTLIGLAELMAGDRR